jgi:hypothetical protein
MKSERQPSRLLGDVDEANEAVDGLVTRIWRDNTVTDSMKRVSE